MAYGASLRGRRRASRALDESSALENLQMFRDCRLTKQRAGARDRTLPIVVDKHAGRIGVTSTVGIDRCFTLHLPVGAPTVDRSRSACYSWTHSFLMDTTYTLPHAPGRV